MNSNSPLPDPNPLRLQGIAVDNPVVSKSLTDVSGCEASVNRHTANRTIRSHALWRLLSLVVILLNGCSGSEGPTRHAVSGFVTLDNQPLQNGVIRLIPLIGPSSANRSEKPPSGPGAMAEILNGEFRFTMQNGPVAGMHRVEIDSVPHPEFDIDDERAFAARMTKTGRSPLPKNAIPAMYNSASILTAEISDTPSPPLSFELRSKAR